MYIAQVFLEFDIDVESVSDYNIAASSRGKIRYNDIKMDLF